jgi:hypothetical protein
LCLLALARPCWPAPLFALEMFPCYIIVTVAHRPAAVSSLATKRPVSPLFPPCALALHLASLAPSRPYRAHGGMCSEAPCCLSPSLSTALPAAVAAAPCHRRLLKNSFAGFGSAESCHAPTLFPCRYLETYSNPSGYLRATSSPRRPLCLQRSLLFST